MVKTGTYIINTKGAMGGWCDTGNPGAEYNHQHWLWCRRRRFYLTKGDILYCCRTKGKTAAAATLMEEEVVVVERLWKKVQQLH